MNARYEAIVVAVTLKDAGSSVANVVLHVHAAAATCSCECSNSLLACSGSWCLRFCLHHYFDTIANALGTKRIISSGRRCWP